MGKKMHNFRLLLASRKGQILFNVLYSWGAAVVIAGALFKIMHWPIGNIVLPVGMIIEVLVFIAAGFDYTTSTSAVGAGGNGDVIVGSGVSSTSAIVGSDTVVTTSDTEKGRSKVGGSGQVVVVGGGSGGYAGGGSVAGSGNVAASTGVPKTGSTVSTPVSGGQTVVPPASGMGAVAAVSGNVTPEYAQSLSNTAQNLDDFSNTIQSLNEAAQKLLGAYKHVTETQGFADNLATLNQNVSGLNDVFNSQLQTITEQMSAIRYINDSLQRMKGLYDGAIGDSYMFKEESAKMTRHIEALNNVYARLLQAMTTNNNNMNHNNF